MDRFSTLSPRLLAVLLLLLLAAAGDVHSLNLGSNTTTVSGISAGGFMAVQYHFTFSESVHGAAIFAGGPYYCAQDAMATALSACMEMPIVIDTYKLNDQARQFASQGLIDGVSSIKGSKVFVFSGKHDDVVKKGVVEKLEDQYKELGAEVTAEYSVDTVHGMPTLDYGNDCGKFGSPFINKCNYDGAGIALKAILPEGRLSSPRGSVNASNIVKLDQHSFVPSGATTRGLGKQAFAYVPSSCRKPGVSCDLHISFPGCDMTIGQIDLDYVLHAGFNQWAETNNLVVLYPQSAKDFLKNPSSCFDWWGYTTSDYADKKGSQIATVANMINHLRQMVF